MARDISSLQLESEDLIPCGALFMCMRPQHLPSELNPGSIIKAVIDSLDEPNQKDSGLRSSYILFAGALIKHQINDLLVVMQADLDKRTTAANGKSPDLDVEKINLALLQRTQGLFFIKLKDFAETLNSGTSGETPMSMSSRVLHAQGQVEKLLPLMCDFSLVNLSIGESVLQCLKGNGITLKDLMTTNEVALAEAIGDDLFAHACREGSSPNSQLCHPGTWKSSLLRTWLTFTLNRFMKQSLDRSIQGVREPVVEYGNNLQLKRLDNELTKIENAYHSLTELDIVDNFERIANAYQDIFNSSHYILYLTTTEYILTEMVQAPETNANEEAVAAYEKDIADRTPVARELVKRIKVACNIMIDLFGGSKLIHENLIAAITVWMEANLFEELISMVSDVMAQPQDNSLEGLQHFMWLISKDKPDFVLNSMRYESSIGSTYFTTITRRIADSLVAFAESVQVPSTPKMNGKEEFNMRLSNILSWLQSGGFPDDERGWRYTKLLFAAINQTAQRPGRDNAIDILLTFKQIDSILDALELSMKCEAWSSRKLVECLQSLTNMDSWVPLLENQCIKLSLGYDEINTSEEDEKEFDRAVAGIVRLTGRRGQLVGKAFQSCLCELLRLAKPQILADIADRVASNRFKFSTSDIDIYKAAGKLETNEKIMDYLSEFYEKRQSDQTRCVTRLVEIMQEETNKGGMNEGVSLFFSLSTPSSTLVEPRLLAIDAMYHGKIEEINKGGINESVSKYICCDRSPNLSSTIMNQRLLEIGAIYNDKFAKIRQAADFDLVAAIPV